MKELIFFLIILIVFFSISCEKEELSPGNKDSANDNAAVNADPTSTNSGATSNDPAGIDSAETLSYLALGDSYTIEQSVAEGGITLPFYLNGFLLQKNELFFSFFNF